MGKNILRLSIILLFIFSISSCSYLEVHQPSSIQESSNLNEIISAKPYHVFIPYLTKEHYALMFDNMDGYWKHGSTVSLNGEDIEIFIPHNETLNRWNQRIEITYSSTHLPITAHKYYIRVIQGNLANMCYDSIPKSRILWQNKIGIVYEYHVMNCGKKPSQVVIGRIIRTPKSIDTISYTVKTDYLDLEQREYMLEIIKSSKLI